MSNLIRRLLCASILGGVALATLGQSVSGQPVNQNLVAEVMFIGRAVERILIVAICGISVVLGFLLFRIVIRDASSVSAKGERFQFSATRIGPGIFFCGFGMAGLIYALQSQPSIQVGSVGFVPAPASAPAFVATGAMSGKAAQTDKSILETRLSALNLAIRVMSKEHGEGRPPDKNIGQAIAIARAWRDQLIADAVGEVEFGKYLVSEERRRSGVAPQLEKDAALRRLYDEVERLRNLSVRVE